MPAHHIASYLLIVATNADNDAQIHPIGGKRRRCKTSGTSAAREGHLEPGHYEIRLKGHLDVRWAAWFVGLSFTHSSDGTTILSGPVVDQAALYGLLRKVRDLGLPLVSVIQVNPKPANGPDVNADTDHNRSKKETNT
jgi:hypothetical protein